ncbi:hypothetical protein REPUB_Repub02eG0102300 [Reevesia pubescens]
MFFIYGHGGTSKTYLWRSLITAIHSTGQIVLVLALLGIASLLLPGGRTTYSRFKIPLSIDDSSTCAISKGTQLAKLIQSYKLIFWDEAPMIHQNCFEALDKTFRDINFECDPSALTKLLVEK